MFQLSNAFKSTQNTLILLLFFPKDQAESIKNISMNGIPCIPTHGKTSLFIGQDFTSIRNYTYAFASHPPFGFMAYTAITYNQSNNLLGLRAPIDYGSGIEWASGLLDTYPNASLNLALYMVDSCSHILRGLLDEDIDKLAHFLKRYPTRSIYLRIGYEFDSEENHYQPAEYIAAFRRISNRFDDLHVNNTALVWHASGFAPREGRSVDEWFPGKQYVDWCGVSLFQQPYECQVASECRFIHAERVALFCKEQSIPLMIAESTPFGGLIDVGDSSKGPNKAGYSGSSWNRWFVPVLAFIERHDVKLWSYIDCNWDSQPMWQRNHAPNIYWGDSRIEKMKDLRVRWVEEVLGAPRFSWALSLDDRRSVCVDATLPRGANRSIVIIPPQLRKRGTVKGLVAYVILAAFIVCILIVTLNCLELIGHRTNPTSYTIIH